ncbi:MAG TPA: phosphoribosyltransferase family protein [Saprospiraceae bacterium]|nr:phosphoribosyltransferase family protein [Saprospiraceae bacterium]
MLLLDHTKIYRKIKRLAIQILEQNYTEPEIILAGINNNGSEFASLLYNELKSISDKTVTLTRISLNPADPLSKDIKTELPIEYYQDKVVVIIDDVANTGRTILYAIKPMLEVLPKKIEVAVLVDRKHKSFPVKVDYVGLELATTLQEDIDVQLKDKDNFVVNLN